MVNEADIKRSCENKSLRWTNHATVRLMQRNISTDDVIHVLVDGEIIEQYPDDYPYPSCLVNGLTLENQRMHVVCGFGNDELWIITAYHPDAEEWTPDFRSRRELSDQ